MFFFLRSRQNIKRGHNSVLQIGFDPVNTKKAQILRFYFQTILVWRPLSSPALVTIVERKKELEEKLTLSILKDLKNNTWPLENSQLFKEVENYITISTSLLSILSSKKFIRSFSIKIVTNGEIKAGDYKPINNKRPCPLVDRKWMKETNNWSEILNEAEITLNSLLTKVRAVELVLKLNGRKIPSIDNLCFSAVSKKVISKGDALKYLDNLIKKLKYEISLSKRVTNQAIHHKN